jgi:hypothetical protein
MPRFQSWRFSAWLAFATLGALSVLSAQRGAPAGEWPSCNGDTSSTKYAYVFGGNQYIVVAIGDVEHPAEYVALGLP